VGQDPEIDEGRIHIARLVGPILLQKRNPFSADDAFGRFSPRSRGGCATSRAQLTSMSPLPRRGKRDLARPAKILDGASSAIRWCICLRNAVDHGSSPPPERKRPQRPGRRDRADGGARAFHQRRDQPRGRWPRDRSRENPRRRRSVECGVDHTRVLPLGRSAAAACCAARVLDGRSVTTCRAGRRHRLAMTRFARIGGLDLDPHLSREGTSFVLCACRSRARSWHIVDLGVVQSSTRLFRSPLTSPYTFEFGTVPLTTD